VTVRGNLFLGLQTLSVAPSVMIVHANTSSQAEATLDFSSNQVTRSSDFSLTLISEQLTALSWTLTLHNNTFTHLTQLAQALIRVRLTDLTRGQLTFS
jgi:hypothetical protein